MDVKQDVGWSTDRIEAYMTTDYISDRVAFVVVGISLSRVECWKR